MNFSLRLVNTKIVIKSLPMGRFIRSFHQWGGEDLTHVFQLTPLKGAESPIIVGDVNMSLFLLYFLRPAPVNGAGFQKLLCYAMLVFFFV